MLRVHSLLSMAESHGNGAFLDGWTGIIRETTAVGVGSIRRRALRALEDTAVATTTTASAAAAEDDQVLAVAEHLDQAEYEFVAELSIACVILAALLVWFFWSFWWEKNMRRRVLASRRRRGQQQQQGTAVVRPQSGTGSYESTRPSGADNTSPSVQGGAGAAAGGGGYRRDVYAVGRDGQEPQQGQGAAQEQIKRGASADRAIRDRAIKEFFNPLWGTGSSSSSSRGTQDQRAVKGRGG